MRQLRMHNTHHTSNPYKTRYSDRLHHTYLRSSNREQPLHPRRKRLPNADRRRRTRISPPSFSLSPLLRFPVPMVTPLPPFRVAIFILPLLFFLPPSPPLSPLILLLLPYPCSFLLHLPCHLPCHLFLNLLPCQLSLYLLLSFAHPVPLATSLIIGFSFPSVVFPSEAVVVSPPARPFRFGPFTGPIFRFPNRLRLDAFRQSWTRRRLGLTMASTPPARRGPRDLGSIRFSMIGLPWGDIQLEGTSAAVPFLL